MTRIFVGNLSYDLTAAELRAAFAAYGPVSSADIVMDGSNGKSKGFGFVEMTGQSHAVAAIQGLDGTDLKGRRMTVSPAHPRGDDGSRGNASRGWDVVGEGRNRW
jgi:RNA recognition motif-containing protein